MGRWKNIKEMRKEIDIEIGIYLKVFFCVLVRLLEGLDECMLVVFFFRLWEEFLFSFLVDLYGFCFEVVLWRKVIMENIGILGFWGF